MMNPQELIIGSRQNKVVGCWLLVVGITLSTFHFPLSTPVAHAFGSADECREKNNFEIARELRLYRAHLYGKKKAKKAPIGNVRYDVDGWAWIKDGPSRWINSDPDNQGLVWSDTVMDEQDEHADFIPLKGIFETKRVQTSELIPYLLQSIRALECRLDALCEVSRFSEIQSGEDPVDIEDVQPIGCVEFTDLKTWPECHFDHEDLTIGHQADTRPYCDEITNQLVRRETELLKLAVEYDAGFRSLLQFAGNFDIFLRELRWPLAGTLRQAAQMIGQFERIPCFLSSCDSAPEIIE